MAKRGERLPYQVRLYAQGADTPGFRSPHSSQDKAVLHLDGKCYVTGPDGAGESGRVGWAWGEVVDIRTERVLYTRTPDNNDDEDESPGEFFDRLIDQDNAAEVDGTLELSVPPEVEAEAKELERLQAAGIPVCDHAFHAVHEGTEQRGDRWYCAEAAVEVDAYEQARGRTGG